MTNEEMQKAMKFILKMDRQTNAKLDRLNKGVNAIPLAQNRSEKRWKRTEERIRALLATAKIMERRIVAQGRKVLPFGKSATDKRLNSLANLVERQISQGRNGKP